MSSYPKHSKESKGLLASPIAGTVPNCCVSLDTHEPKGIGQLLRLQKTALGVWRLEFRTPPGPAGELTRNPFPPNQTRALDVGANELLKGHQTPWPMPSDACWGVERGAGMG